MLTCTQYGCAWLYDITYILCSITCNVSWGMLASSPWPHLGLMVLVC